MIKGAAAAIDFFGRAFGAVQVERYDHEGRVGHAMLDINGGQIMLSDEYPEYVEVVGTLAPETLGGTTVTVHLSVDDVDAAFDRAVAAGAHALRQPEDQFFGRHGKLRDPFGHVWSLVGPKKGR
jgi:PhnB protein